MAALLTAADAIVEVEAVEAAGLALDVAERPLLLAAMAAIAPMERPMDRIERERGDTRAASARGEATARAWRGGRRRPLEGLFRAIAQQFVACGPTPADAEIAAPMLGGPRPRDVGRLRRTSEATVRRQAQGIDRKSGPADRTELSACSLKDLSPVAGDDASREAARQASWSGRPGPARRPPLPPPPRRFLAAARPGAAVGRGPRAVGPLPAGGPRPPSKAFLRPPSHVVGPASRADVEGPRPGRDPSGAGTPSPAALVKGSTSSALGSRDPGATPAPGHSPRPYSSLGPTSGTGDVMPPDRGRTGALRRPACGGSLERARLQAGPPAPYTGRARV